MLELLNRVSNRKKAGKSALHIPPLSDFTAHYNSNKLVNIVASAAFTEANENWQDAVALFHKWVNSDIELLKAITKPMIDLAIKNAVHDLGRSKRKEFFRSTVHAGAENKVSRMVEQVRSKMDYTLSGGKRLGDANRTELDAEITFFTAQSDTMAFKARWFSLIRKRLKDDNIRVQDVLTDGELDKLEQTARKN